MHSSGSGGGGVQKKNETSIYNDDEDEKDKRKRRNKKKHENENRKNFCVCVWLILQLGFFNCLIKGDHERSRKNSIYGEQEGKRRIERLTKAMQKQRYIHFVVVVKVY